MPRNRVNSTPPPVMTWGKALPVLAVCALFDGIRFMFEQFWFFAPLLIGLGVSSFFGGGVIGTAAGAVAGGASAWFGDFAIEIFGIFMAMAVGFLGWLTIFFILFMTNARIFKRNAFSMLWLLLGLGVSEVPFLGTIPALTSTVLKMYFDQIKLEKKDLLAWKEQQAQQTYLQQRAIAAQLAIRSRSEEIPEDAFEEG